MARRDADVTCGYYGLSLFRAKYYESSRSRKCMRVQIKKGNDATDCVCRIESGKLIKSLLVPFRI